MSVYTKFTNLVKKGWAKGPFMITIWKVMLTGIVFAISVLLLWVLPYSQLEVPTVANYLSVILPFTYITLFIIIELERGEESPTRSRRLLFKEYRVLNQSVGRRENSLLVAGSIFVTASLLLLGQAAQLSKEPSLMRILVFTSWAVYSIWLFLFQLTAGRMTDVTFDRLRGIERRLGIKIHTYLANKRDPVRRWVWLWLLNGLLAAGGLVLGSDLSLFKTSLPFQILLMTLPALKKKEKTEEPIVSGL